MYPPGSEINKFMSSKIKYLSFYLISYYKSNNKKMEHLNQKIMKIFLLLKFVQRTREEMHTNKEVETEYEIEKGK